MSDRNYNGNSNNNNNAGTNRANYDTSYSNNDAYSNNSGSGTNMLRQVSSSNNNNNGGQATDRSYYQNNNNNNNNNYGGGRDAGAVERYANDNMSNNNINAHPYRGSNVSGTSSTASSNSSLLSQQQPRSYNNAGDGAVIINRVQSDDNNRDDARNNKNFNLGSQNQQRSENNNNISRNDKNDPSNNSTSSGFVRGGVNTSYVPQLPDSLNNNNNNNNSNNYDSNTEARRSSVIPPDFRSSSSSVSSMYTNNNINNNNNNNNDLPAPPTANVASLTRQGSGLSTVSRSGNNSNNVNNNNNSVADAPVPFREAPSPLVAATTNAFNATVNANAANTTSNYSNNNYNNVKSSQTKIYKLDRPEDTITISASDWEAIQMMFRDRDDVGWEIKIPALRDAYRLKQQQDADEVQRRQQQLLSQQQLQRQQLQQSSSSSSSTSASMYPPSNSRGPRDMTAVGSPSLSNSSTNTNTAGAKPRPTSASVNNKNTRGAPIDKCRFSILTFNVLNEEHYVNYSRALHKMKAQDRFEIQRKFIEAIVNLNPDLHFLCLQEVNVVDFLPIFQFLKTRGFDFVFSMGKDYSFSAILAMLRDPKTAARLPTDMLVIIFDAVRFKTVGFPTVKVFPGAQQQSSSTHSPAGAGGGSIAKAALFQLFEDSVTNHLFKVVNVHVPFEHDDANKLERIKYVVDDCNKPPGSTFILCGDLNIDDRRDGNLIRSGFNGWTEATASVRATSISASGNAVQKIDYIFMKGPAIRLDLSKGRTEKDACVVDPENENVLLKHQGNDPLFQNSFCSDHASVMARIEIG